MKTFKQNLLWVSLAAVALTGCGSSDEHDDHEEEHDHELAILVSQTSTSTLSLLEEGELEALEDAAAGNGASLVLGEIGKFAAVLANGTVNFIHGLHEDEEESEEAHDESEEEHEEEAHVLDFSLTGSQVIATNGHFAVLNGGMTTFVAYDELENESPVTEVFDAVVGQDYPALILDETHDLVQAFDGTDALVYEGSTLEASFACANPSSHGQAHEVIAVTCGTDVKILAIEENADTSEHVFSVDTFTNDLAGTPANYVWRAQGEVVVGFEPNTSHYVIAELDEESGQIELVASSDTDAFTSANNICDMQFDTNASDILAITAAGQFVALDHEAQSLKTITLDESANSSCSDMVLASAAKAAVVVDNQAQMVYGIDVDDVEANPNGYHVHERKTLSVTDIQSMVIFHEVEVEVEEEDHAAH